MRVAVYGAGQVGHAVVGILTRRPGIEVNGPFGRGARDEALASGADVVVIATTSFLTEVGPDIRVALEHASNVITTAEEAAYPWAVDATVATALDDLARSRGVTVVGVGLNPGFLFDALVITTAGPVSRVDTIQVDRTVDLSGFSAPVLNRIGVGHSPDSFALGLDSGSITGHIGFRQSMHVVAAQLGLILERVEQVIQPIFATTAHSAAHLSVAAGDTAGFEQRYVGIVGGAQWFEANFVGHVSLPSIGLAPRDEITIDGSSHVHLSADPGFNPQAGAPALIANSLLRVHRAAPGWLTVGDLPPAAPTSLSLTA